jgi:hypothetical protein
MGILRRWQNWLFWHVWHELRQRWYCWRHGVLPVARSICIWSITIDGEEILATPVPGIAFSGAELVTGAIVRVAEGSEISIRAENLTTRAVPFVGCIFVTQLDGSSCVYPFPPVLLQPKTHPFPPARIAVRVVQAGRFMRLVIPDYARAF